MKNTIEPKTRKGQATKQKMIEVAARLIHKNGVNATTVNDILQHSKTGKSQFSHYFGNKQTLVKEVIELHESKLIAQQLKIIRDFRTVEDIKILGAYYIQLAGEFLKLYNGGCPLGQISVETPGSDITVLNQINSTFSSVQNLLTERFTWLQDQSILSSKVDANELAEFLVASIQGGFLLSKIQQSVDPLIKVINQIGSYFELLSLEPKQKH